jgi:hypothetical protein
VEKDAVIVGSPEVYESSRLLSLFIDRLVEEYNGGIVVVASPPRELEAALWEFLRWKSPYGVDGLVKRFASHYTSIARALIGSERESEIVSGEIARLSEELRWLLWAIASSRSYTEQQAALLLTYPAKLSAALTAAALRSHGVEALWLSGREAGLLAKGHPLNATLDTEIVKTTLKDKLEGILERDVTIVLAGSVAGSVTAGEAKLLGWGGEVKVALTAADVLGFKRVEVYYGEKGIRSIVFEDRAECACPEKVSAESLSLAAAIRAVRFPAPLPKVNVELKILGLAGCEALITDDGGHIAAFRRVRIYSRDLEVGGEEYCRLASINIPGVELEVGIPFEEAIYCTNPRYGYSKTDGVIATGPPDVLSSLTNLNKALMTVSRGKLLLAVWQGKPEELILKR